MSGGALPDADASPPTAATDPPRAGKKARPSPPTAPTTTTMDPQPPAAAPPAPPHAHHSADEMQIDEDLHSRQLAVYGRGAMKRMAGATVLVCGLGGLGVEVGESEDGSGGGGVRAAGKQRHKQGGGPWYVRCALFCF